MAKVNGFQLNSRERLLGFFLFFLLLSFLPLPAQNPVMQNAPAAEGSNTLIANYCPKLILAGTARRVKFYGAHLAEVELKSEEDDISFYDYITDADHLAFTVTIEAKPTARLGRRNILLLVGAAEPKNPIQTLTIYVLKKEDKALMQKDLMRCPWMREEESAKTPKQAPLQPPKARP